jgi:predicted protein tyrosine phosphatase
MKNILFVCTENLQRSPTAEELFKNSKKYSAKSAGISPFSKIQINNSAIEWADYLIVMEDFHKEFILKNFPASKQKNILVLNIPDIYYKNDPELIRILKEKLKKEGIFQPQNP